ncbi:MAG TPA: hypothetical protein VM425_06740 [Myxococcota bacterium]|nr:hypothetical protein [Myxococcota bacterium]
MGTQQLPDSKPDADVAAVIEDSPRIGFVTWIMLATFLIPPAAVAYLEGQSFRIPHPMLWEILLGLPIFVMLLTFPRCYRLSERELSIVGFFYRVRIPKEEILSLEPTSFVDAFIKPGSIFCTNPRRALILKRRKGCDLVISPGDPAPFLESVGRPQEAGKGEKK